MPRAVWCRAAADVSCAAAVFGHKNFPTVQRLLCVAFVAETTIPLEPDVMRLRIVSDLPNELATAFYRESLARGLAVAAGCSQPFTAVANRGYVTAAVHGEGGAADQKFEGWWDGATSVKFEWQVCACGAARARASCPLTQQLPSHAAAALLRASPPRLLALKLASRAQAALRLLLVLACRCQFLTITIPLPSSHPPAPSLPSSLLALSSILMIGTRSRAIAHRSAGSRRRRIAPTPPGQPAPRVTRCTCECSTPSAWAR